MSQQELQKLVQDLQALPKECEWLEFNVNNGEPHTIGENISALSNSACYEGKHYGYLNWFSLVWESLTPRKVL